ncbi:MAG: ribbon-helix-helix protein, CopG family [Rhodoglobus sp.]
MPSVATNLRLPESTAALLRARSAASGLSQHAIILDALESYLRPDSGARPDDRRLLARGLLSPPRIPYREAETLLELPPGVTSLDLLDRDDRF